MKHIRIWISALLTAALLLALCAPVYAGDARGDTPEPGEKEEAQLSDGEGTPIIAGSSSGENAQPAAVENAQPAAGENAQPAIGENTQPVQTDPAGSGQPVVSSDGRVWLTNTMSFDRNTRRFVYPVGSSGTEVQASVANGMIVTSTVEILGATLLIYKDGQLWEGDATKIQEPGEYVVMAQTGSQTPRLFTFTLVGAATSSVYAYNLPTGMYVTGATLNGEPTDYGRSSVPMQEDGLYHVEYECIAAGTAYVLDLQVDRTPPALEFSGKIDDSNHVHSALAFSGLEPGDSLQVSLDGTPIDVTVHADGTGELTQSGSYLITAYDAAGNASEYGYTVLLYFDSSSIAFFALLAISIVAVAVYIFVKRKRLEIG